MRLHCRIDPNSGLFCLLGIEPLGTEVGAAVAAEVTGTWGESLGEKLETVGAGEGPGVGTLWTAAETSERPTRSLGV